MAPGRALDEDMINMSLGYTALNCFTGFSFLRRNAAHDLSFNGNLAMMSIAMALASAYGTPRHGIGNAAASLNPHNE